MKQNPIHVFEDISDYFFMFPELQNKIKYSLRLCILLELMEHSRFNGLWLPMVLREI